MLLHFVGEDEYAFYFPDTEAVERHWEEAQDDPAENYHVKATLRSVFGWIEVAEGFGESPGDKIWQLIEDTDVESRALTAAGAVTEWYERDDRAAYDNARAAINLLDIGYENALEQGWDSVAIFCLRRIADLKNQLNSIERSEIERAVALMEDVTDDQDVHLGNLSDLLQLLLNNAPALDPEGAAEKRAFVICIREANDLHLQADFSQERAVLGDTIELADSLGMPTADLERRYTDTYWLNADHQAERSASLEASEIVEGLDDDTVLRVLSDDEKEAWKSRLRSAVQSAATELKREGATIDSPHHRWLHQQSVDKFVHQFKHIKLVYNVDAALFWLLTHDELVPRYTEETETHGIHEEISKMMYSQQGHLIEFDPDEADLPARYSIQARITISTLVSVLSTLLEQRELTEGDIYSYLNGIIGLDSNNLWYLTRVTTNVFEGRDVEAIHLGATRVEALLYRLLREEGEDVDALMDEGTGTRTLGSLVPKLGEYVGEDFQEYIRYAYGEPVGQMFGGNIRNRIAHGLLLPRENNRLYSLLILADLLRILTRITRTEHLAWFGIPDAVLRPTPGLNPPFPLVIRGYRRHTFPSEVELTDSLDSGGQPVEEVAEKLGVPHSLAMARVRLSEAAGVVTLDEETGEISLTQS